MTLKPRINTESEYSKQTLKIPRPVHKRLRQICIERNVSMQDIFVDALDRWLIAEGERGIAEIEAQGAAS